MTCRADLEWLAGLESLPQGERPYNSSTVDALIEVGCSLRDELAEALAGVNQLLDLIE